MKKSWTDKLDITQAIKDVQYDARRADFCIDPLRFEDLSVPIVRESLVDFINTKLKKNYSPKELIKIDVPKSNFILRPAAHPTIIDWIIYHALVNYIGSKIYKKIPKNSFSFNKFRDKQRNKIKNKLVDYWKEFEKEAYDMSKDNRFSYLLTTDITSFFENICLKVLNERLKILSNDPAYVSSSNFLTNNLLLKWTINNKIEGFGLPQGPNASIILADIYLYPVDKAMGKCKDIKFIRYNDDIKVFATDITQLKMGLMVLVRELRKLKLNLNAKKTSIYKLNNEERLKKVFDPERNRLNLIDKAMRKKNRSQIEMIEPSLYELYDLALYKKSNFRERYLRFFLGKLVDLMKLQVVDKAYIRKLVKELLILFEKKHHQAKLFSWFFVASAQYSSVSKKIISKRLVAFVCDKNRNIYEWQEMWALDTIRQLGVINRTEFKILKSKYTKDNNLCYMQYALIAGSKGDHDEKEDILNVKRCESDQYRATLLSIQELHRDVVENANLEVPKYFRLYIDHVRRQKNKIYGFQFNLRYEDFVEESYEDKEEYDEGYEIGEYE